MTREKAIETLQEQRKRYCEDNYLDSNYKIVVNAFDMAVKVLGQEPVLDKISAEVTNLTDGETPERIWNVDVLQIIDKYKAESEDKECG